MNENAKTFRKQGLSALALYTVPCSSRSGSSKDSIMAGGEFPLLSLPCFRACCSSERCSATTAGVTSCKYEFTCNRWPLHLPVQPFSL